ncbi:DHA2 family efflux MFS transporter permease subunit [Pseudoxanthobacter sp.]|uniref:DHA2 family efflux MFS transporter permease subunit n=1 Tax=Pseudoxanthobacter sp. TaxID=1925742 RepID=UPI002FE3C2F9
MVDRTRVIPLLVACAVGMEMIDSTVIATALPAIAGDFGVRPLTLAVAVTAYMLSLAVFIPISGWVSDRFGSRNVFQAAIVLFLAGSVGCAFANSVPELVVARVIQGIGGSMTTPVGRLVLVRTVPKERLVDAMALVAIPALVGPLIGPPLGGFIVEHYSWRWIFWINVPIGIIGLLLGALVLPRDEHRASSPFDLKGFALIAIGLSLMMGGLETAGRGVVDGAATLGLIAAGAVLTALYVLHARRAEKPVIELKLLQVRTFSSTVLGGFLSRSGMGALAVLTPLMLQVGYGFSPLEAGILSVSAAVGAMGAKSAVTRIIATLGFRRTLLVFSAATGASIVPMGFTRPDLFPLGIVLLLLVSGVVRSVLFTTMQTLTYADVDDDHMSQATSFASVAQQLSLAAGVAIGTVLVHVFSGLGFAQPGGQPAPFAFALAFIVVGVMSMSSLLSFRTLPADAGANYTPGARRGGRGRPVSPAAPSLNAIEGSVGEMEAEAGLDRPVREGRSRP